MLRGGETVARRMIRLSVVQGILNALTRYHRTHFPIVNPNASCPQRDCDGHQQQYGGDPQDRTAEPHAVPSVPAVEFPLGVAKQEPISVTLDNSQEARWVGPSDRPVCHLSAGVIAGYSSRILGEDLHAREVRCAAMGAPQCRFEVS